MKKFLAMLVVMYFSAQVYASSLALLTVTPQHIAHRATVICMHGLGGHNTDYQNFTTHMQHFADQFGVKFIFPQALTIKTTYNAQAQPAWFDITNLDYNNKDDIAGLRQSQQALNDIINLEIARGIPSNKIILAGHSQGGAIAIYTGLRYPQQLAGILVISAWVPAAHTVNEEKSWANLHTPIVFMHGSSDMLIRDAWTAECVNMLKESGYSKISMMLYPGLEHHNVIEQEINVIGALMQEWLMI